MKSLFPFLSKLLLFVALFASCGEKRPDSVYNSRKMEEILYDYHLAQALANLRSDSADFYRNGYTAAVFEKHHTTQEIFDSSMLWYMQHIEELYEVYDRLDERLESEAQTGRATIRREKNLAEGVDVDTLDIWPLFSHQLLSTSLGGNRLYFSLQIDSVFAPNDQLVWNFTSQWLYKDGKKQATAMLIVVYEGDSIVTRQQSLYRNNSERITLKIANRPVKEIKGFIYQSTTWSAKSRLLSLADVSLLCIHKRTAIDSVRTKDVYADTLKVDDLKPDSLKTDSLRQDSLKHDTVQFETLEPDTLKRDSLSPRMKRKRIK